MSENKETAEIVYVNGRPVRKVKKIKVEYEYEELKTLFADCKDLIDIILAAGANGIPFTLKSPGIPSRKKDTPQELWRLKLYAEKTETVEAYTHRGLANQLAALPIAVPPMTIDKALNEDYRDKEIKDLNAMIEDAVQEAAEAGAALKDELRDLNDTVAA